LVDYNLVLAKQQQQQQQKQLCFEHVLCTEHAHDCISHAKRRFVANKVQQTNYCLYNVQCGNTSMYLLHVLAFPALPSSLLFPMLPSLLFPALPYVPSLLFPMCLPSLLFPALPYVPSLLFPMCLPSLLLLTMCAVMLCAYTPLFQACSTARLLAAGGVWPQHRASLAASARAAAVALQNCNCLFCSLLTLLSWQSTCRHAAAAGCSD
jgi:hypothetical protein